MIDEEVRAIVESCHQRATKLLSEHIDVLHNMARVLVERETIHTEEVEMLVAGKSADEVIAAMDKDDHAETPVATTSDANSAQSAQQSANDGDASQTDNQTTDDKGSAEDNK